MSVSLYRKYRPQTFSGIIGQKAAVSVLTSAITRQRIGHAYLFSGSRGCGKTSAARIFAKALNCLDREGYEPCGKCRNCQDITAGESLDVVEIDGASNNGVDNIRGLRENIALSPFTSRYKVYIIDEVHMLSQGAFNALLKTLEEPPEHVIFIMATTEPHKVPVTIRSRCQHIPFRSITPDDICARLEFVCKSEGITYEAEALREISRQADGALRDALSLLEQVSSSGEVTLSGVEAVFGAGSRPVFERWISSLRERPEEAYLALKAMFDAGASPVRVFEEMFSLARDLWIVSKWKNLADGLGFSGPERDFLADEASRWNTNELRIAVRSSLSCLTEARQGVRSDILLGMLMLYLEDRNLYAPRKNDAPVSVQATPAHVMPAPVTPAPVGSPVPKGELLAKIKELNALMWYALFDAETYARGRELVLDAAHRYTFSVMRIDRHAADLSEAFADYERVILRFGSCEYVCPNRKDEEIPALSEIFARNNSAPPPQESQPVPAPKPAPEIPMPAPSSQPKTTGRQPQTAFGKIISSLRSFGLKPEIITHTQNEAETDTDTDTDSQEGDTE